MVPCLLHASEVLYVATFCLISGSTRVKIFLVLLTALYRQLGCVNQMTIIIIVVVVVVVVVGRDSSVGIATRYGLDGPEIEFRWGRDFPHPSRPALGPTQHLIQ